jgi:uncharacterized protein (DUF2252 family)
MTNKTVLSIEKFNQGRIEGLLQLKYKNMQEDIFSFYRGTAHLFYEQIKKKSFLYDSPAAWICGDLHFENFGSYKGENGQVYFDINDFDEAILAPCLLDIARFLVSLRLIAQMSKMTKVEENELCKHYLNIYCETLISGNSRWVEKETAKGLIKELLTKVEQRKSIAELYSNKKGEIRELNFKYKKIVKPNKEEKEEIHTLISQWNKDRKVKSLYDIVDIGYHIKGTGSLGLQRYVLLVLKKSNKKFKLIDLKLATPSCVKIISKLKQPHWFNEAERTIEIQKRVQGTYQDLLKSIQLGNKSFILREYQSCEDKMNYKLLNGDIKMYSSVLTTMAQITAWGQLQSSGRQGSAITDTFIEFGINKKIWQNKILKFTNDYVKIVEKDYNIFCKHFDSKKSVDNTK